MITLDAIIPDLLPRWWLDHAAAIGRAIAHGGNIPEAQRALAALAVAIPYTPLPYGPHTPDTIEDHWRAVRTDRRRFARHVAAQAYRAELRATEPIKGEIARMAHLWAKAGRSNAEIKAEAKRIAGDRLTDHEQAEAAIPAASNGARARAWTMRKTA